MSELLNMLIEAANRGVDLDLFLDNHSKKLTSEFAKELHEVFKQAFQAGNESLASFAAMTSSIVYLRIGKKHEALDEYLNYYQILYMKAERTEEYLDLYKQIQFIVQRADEIGAEDIGFKALILSAECAYFIFSASNSNLQDDWIFAALNNLLKASNKASYCNGTWFEKFVDTLADSLVKSEPLIWPDNIDYKDYLSKFAPIIEELIPSEFEFSEQFPNHIQKTYQAARVFADISFRFGNPIKANSRLNFSIKRAEETKDVENWINSVVSLYSGRKISGASSQELIEIQRDIIKRVNVFRNVFKSRSGRLWASQEMDHIIGELLVVDRLKENNIDGSELFEFIETLKSRTLLDQLETDFLDIRDEESKKKVLEMEKHFLEFVPYDSEDLFKFEMRLASRLPIGTLWDSAMERELLISIEDIYANNKAGFQKVEKVVNLSQLMNNLQPDEIIIEYFIPFHELHPSYELWILVITSSKVHIIPAITEHFEKSAFIGRVAIDGKEPVDFSPLGNLVVNLRTAIRKEEEEIAEDYLKNLYNLLILPVKNFGIKLQDFHRIIIVPHGILHYVPFAALLNPEGHYLIEEIALNVVPSASVWYRLQEFQRPKVKNFLGFFNPTLTYVNLPSLESSEKELGSILKYLNGINLTVCKRDEATEESFRTYINDKNIVHIACHGDFPEENAIDFHNILLCSSDKHDGRLNAEEFRYMKLNSIRLFVLSVCSSCLYRFGPGDEPYGLISALLSKKTENILGTLWPVEDEIGVYFIDEFYKNLLTLGPAEALRRASILLIKDQALLRHWAGYILIGVGRPFLKESSHI